MWLKRVKHTTGRCIPSFLVAEGSNTYMENLFQSLNFAKKKWVPEQFSFSCSKFAKVEIRDDHCRNVDNTIIMTWSRSILVGMKENLISNPSLWHLEAIKFGSFCSLFYFLNKALCKKSAGINIQVTNISF